MNRFDTRNIKKFLNDNRWIIAASVFFIVWKFFLIGVMWEGRSIPPEPDDSFQYIANIASVSECHTGLFCPYPGISMTDASGFTYLTYRIFFGTLVRLTGLSPDIIFHVSFYIGTILLTLLLPVFLKSFTGNKHLLAWTILFLSLYHGTGETHGFFWVVPSFYLILLFFTLFIYVARNNLNRWLAIGAAVAFTFSHPMGVYLCFVLPIYLGIYWLLSGKIQVGEMKKVTLIIVMIVLSTVSQTLYLKHFEQIDSYGPGSQLSQAKMIVSKLNSDGDASETDGPITTYDITNTKNKGLVSNKIETINIAYFRYVTPHWTAIILLLGVLTLLIIKREYRLVSLYISSLVFFVLATFLSTFGFRSAIVLWPLTYIVYAFGAWYLLKFSLGRDNPFHKWLLTSAIIIAIAIFFGVNAILAFTFNVNQNMRHKYAIDPSLFGYLNDEMKRDDNVSLNVILVRTPGGVNFYLNGKVVSPTERPTYITVIDESSVRLTDNESPLTRTLSGIVSDRLGISIQPILSTLSPSIPQGYDLKKEYGVVKIYRRTE